MTRLPGSLDRARELLAAHPIVDGHNDLPFEMRQRFDYDLDRYDVSQRQSATQTDLVRLAEGGVGAQFWSVYVPGEWAGERAVAATLEQVDFVHRMVARYPDRLSLVRSVAEVEQARAAGRIGALLGAEGGHSIAESLAVLRMLFALGVRYLTLTHNVHLSWADSAAEPARIGGLSDFGRDVVGEMNRLGMLVDLSHTAVETMRAAIEATSAPVIFSHSSARALCDHRRNVPDEVLAELGRNGGVCMVTFVPYFVSEECRGWYADVRAEMAARGEDPGDIGRLPAAAARHAQRHPEPKATISQVADHVEHVREVAGIGHVGIGGDYDGSARMPCGLEDVSCYPALIAELIDRGWSDDDLAALTWDNIIRVLADAEAVARRTADQYP